MNFKSNHIKFLLLFIYILGISIAAVKADEVDGYVRSQLSERHIPGVAIAVIKNGKIIKSKGYGLASVEFEVRRPKKPYLK